MAVIQALMWGLIVLAVAMVVFAVAVGVLGVIEAARGTDRWKKARREAEERRQAILRMRRQGQ